MTTFDPAELAESLSRAMTEAVRRGFQPPLQLICVGANGTLFAGQWVEDLHGGWAFESTVEYERPDGLLPPVNIIVIDSATGKGFRLVLKGDREQFVN